jgi:tRNA dimethylallyltransferase
MSDALCRALPIVVLYGPTGVGKTQLAIELCCRLGGEIIGADSVQVYRGFDIGSGKPTPEELGGVVHHLIDVLEPSEAIDAMRYAELADRAIELTLRAGRVPIVAGGTGLWLRALLRGLVSVPPPDPALRAELEAEFRRDPEGVRAKLLTVDPIAAARVHPNDMIRTVRALEVHAQTGRALGALREAHARGTPRYRSLVLSVELAEPHYTAAIERRTRAMLERGLVREVEGLVERYGRDVRPLHSVGYRQVLDHLQGSASLEETEQRIVQATRSYARRQRTWARTDPDIALHLTPADARSSATLARIRSHIARS